MRPAGSVKDGAWQAHDAILDMLNLHGAGQQKLGSGNDVPGNFSKPGAAGSSGKGAGAAEAAAGDILTAYNRLCHCRTCAIAPYIPEEIGLLRSSSTVQDSSRYVRQIRNSWPGHFTNE